MGDTVYSIIVIGAGASGLAAAITAARRGMSVLVLEHMNRPAKKLLATGNGKCNFTNENMSPKFYHGDSALIASVLRQFSHADCLDFFREIGVFPKNKRGYYYPNSEQAASVADALLAEMSRLNVKLMTETAVTGVQGSKGGFLCRTDRESYHAHNVIFATGLNASPKLGSDGSAIPLIESLGHHFTPILPALCGFYCEGMDFRRVAGVRCDAALTLEIDGQIINEERGELQLTDYGLSGIPVFQLSSEAVRSLYEKKSVLINIDFLPDLDDRLLAAELFRRRDRHKQSSIQMLCGLLHGKLIAACLKAADISDTCMTKNLSEADIRRLSAVLKKFSVRLIKGREAEYAQVCTGGIRTEELHIDTLESRLHPGLYFVGELLNADGICGGYNLQWAWSTGVVAAKSAE